MSDITRDWSFGGQVKTARLKAGITLRDAAALLRMEPSHLSRLELNEIEPPTKLSQIMRICEAFDIKGWDMLAHTAFQHHLAKLRKEFTE